MRKDVDGINTAHISLFTPNMDARNLDLWNQLRDFNMSMLDEIAPELRKEEMFTFAPKMTQFFTYLEGDGLSVPSKFEGISENELSENKRLFNDFVDQASQMGYGEAHEQDVSYKL